MNKTQSLPQELTAFGGEVGVGTEGPSVAVKPDDWGQKIKAAGHCIHGQE